MPILMVVHGSTGVGDAVESGSAALDHDAFVYRSLDEFVDFGVPFVTGGLAGGAEVFVAAAADSVAALRSALGGEPAGVTLRDTREWAPHPATRLRAFHDLVRSRLAAGVPTLRLMGEPLWPSGPPAERREWARYESVLNTVLAPFPVTLVCLYDGASLAPQIVTDAGRTHPEFTGPTGTHPSGAFEDPPVLLRHWTSRPAAPPETAAHLEAPVDVSAARRFVADQASRAGVGASQAADLAIAASEVLTNATQHGGGIELLAVWTEDGRLLCQVEDAGPGIEDPLAGYRPPLPDEIAGRGLWLARQLVELVEVVPKDAGTLVKLHVDLAGSRAA